MANNKHFKSVLCLVMTVMMLLSVVLCVSAAVDEVAQTGATTTVYFKNTDNWSTVNAYCWVKGTDTSVKSWPGESMTLVEGNVYKYTINGDYNCIIFNNGSTQTGDLDVAGDGQIFDYSTNSWGPYDKHVETPTTAPDPTTTQPTTTQPTTSEIPSDSKMVYCKNSAGWGTVTCYMWKDGSGDNGGWPGKAMTNIYDDVWQYEVTGDYNMIIFSNSGQSQTGDMSFPGAGYIYDNSTGKWEKYDTSPITVKSTTTNIAAPQYEGTDITLQATATSTGGTVYYKFSVKNTSNTTVLSDYSTKNSAVWTPTTAGTYTLVYEFKDAAGNTNERTTTYEIKDDANVAQPILKGVTPKPGQMKKGTTQTISINAGGGKTGTNLLFYKVKVTDPSGKTVNVPYYSKTASCKFTPTTLGTYTVTVYVQASDNETVERSYTYSCVNEITDDDIDIPIGGTLKGDADDNGDVNVIDATVIQKCLANQMSLDSINQANAEVDGDGAITVLDATMIQKFVASIITW